MDVVCHLYQVLPTDRWQIVAQADLRFISTTIWLAAVACPPRHAAPLTSPHCKISRCHIYAQQRAHQAPSKSKNQTGYIPAYFFTHKRWLVGVCGYNCIDRIGGTSSTREGGRNQMSSTYAPFPLFPASQVPVNQRGETHPHNSGSRLVSVTRKK
jgi:hypothetical protein